VQRQEFVLDKSFVNDILFSNKNDANAFALFLKGIITRNGEPSLIIWYKPNNVIK